jgi:hypothetical protein
VHKFQVSITDPVKHGDALMGYTLYRVTTQTTMPEYPSTSGSYVLRRYSDFEWLHLAVRKCVVCFAPLPLAHSLTRLHHGWAQQVNRTAAPGSRSATHPSNTQSNRDVWGSVTGQTLRWLDAAETYGCVGWGWGGGGLRVQQAARVHPAAAAGEDCVRAVRAGVRRATNVGPGPLH